MSSLTDNASPKKVVQNYANIKVLVAGLIGKHCELVLQIYICVCVCVCVLKYFPQNLSLKFGSVVCSRQYSK